MLMLINRSEIPDTGVEINPKAPVQSMVKRIAVAGYGAVGRALAERLASKRKEWLVLVHPEEVQRRSQNELDGSQRSRNY